MAVFVYRASAVAPSGISASDIEVGKEVLINENGTPVNYLVVQQGKPSSMYDNSCAGTWLLRKDIAENRVWDSGNVNDYANSDINSYLNGDWLNRYDTDVADQIVQCKIPYRAGSGTSTAVTSGANGLSTKAFLLSATELSFNMSNMPVNEGAELSYFSGCSDSGSDTKRVFNYSGSSSLWWSRSPGTGNPSYVVNITSNGAWGNNLCSISFGILPCIILPFTFKFQESQIVS